MNTITKLPVSIARYALAAAVLATVPVGLLASEDSDDIIVRSQSAMEKWQAETTRDLNRYLRARPTTSFSQPGNAIVQVSFSIGDDGAADDIALYKSSGNPAANGMAKRAIGRLTNLHTVPVGNPKEARFLANIVFADSERSYDRLVDKLEKSERQRLASKGPARTYIALRN